MVVSIASTYEKFYRVYI